MGRRRVRALARRQDASPSSPTRTASASLRLLDTASGRELPGPKLPLGVDRQPRAGTRTAGAIGFTLSTARARPPTCTRSTSTTGKLERWTESETGGPERRDLRRAGARSAGRASTAGTISGFLYTPAAAKFPGKRPVIIDIHGGPEGQSRPGFLGRDNYYRQRARRRGRSTRTCAARPATARPSSTLDNGVQREDSVQGHRRPARLDRDPARTSTPTA